MIYWNIIIKYNQIIQINGISRYGCYNWEQTNDTKYIARYVKASHAKAVNCYSNYYVQFPLVLCIRPDLQPNVILGNINIITGFYVESGPCTNCCYFGFTCLNKVQVTFIFIECMINNRKYICLMSYCDYRRGPPSTSACSFNRAFFSLWQFSSLLFLSCNVHIWMNYYYTIYSYVMWPPSKSLHRSMLSRNCTIYFFKTIIDIFSKCCDNFFYLGTRYTVVA